MKFFSSNLFDMVPNFFEVEEETGDKNEQENKLKQRALDDTNNPTILDGKTGPKGRTNRYCNLHPKLEEEE